MSYVSPPRVDVGAEIAALDADSVGSTGTFFYSGGAISPGETTSGANLTWGALSSGATDSGPSPAGVWMALSYHDDSTNRLGAFRRVS